MNESAPFVPEFESLDDLLAERAFLKRPVDIIVGGERLLSRENSPEQQESLKRANKLVVGRMQELGLPTIEFERRRIIFAKFKSREHGAGQYHESDIVFIKEENEANI